MTGELQSLLQTAITVVVFLVMLGVLVLIHELGHFVAARLARVRALEFGIGFPPRARVLGTRGETTYTLNWLPIGGFVKLEGEDGDSDDPRSFTVARLPIKLLILVAGVTMNIVLAFVIFFGIAWLADPGLGLGFSQVQAGSPAAAVGLRQGDTITSVDGEQWSFFGSTTVVDTLGAHAGEAVRLGIKHADGSTANITVTLRSKAEIDSTHGALGISGLKSVALGTYTQHDPATALGTAQTETVNALRLILDGLGQLGSSLAHNPTAAPPVSGPVGIAATVGDTLWQFGPIFTLYLAGILSANLALVNFLPFPPLDGGRMLVLVIKAVLGTRVSQSAERLTYFVGFVFLFGFLLWITYFDIARQIAGGTP